jgi:hypothetical protein
LLTTSCCELSMRFTMKTLLHPFIACAIDEANIRPQVKSAHQWTKFNPLGMYCGKT